MLPVDNQIDEKAKKILEVMEELDTVISEQFRIKRDLLNITESVRQCRHTLQKLREERESLVREFWRNKNG